MTLYEFVRKTLEASGGSCLRGELLNAIVRNDESARRLSQSKGFEALLNNMKHSGFIELHGEVVRRTKRRVGKRRV